MELLMILADLLIATFESVYSVFERKRRGEP